MVSVRENLAADSQPYVSSTAATAEAASASSAAVTSCLSQSTATSSQLVYVMAVDRTWRDKLLPRPSKKLSFGTHKEKKMSDSLTSHLYNTFKSTTTKTNHVDNM